MAAFDPDAYLASTAPKAPPSGFDPDAYLASTAPKPPKGYRAVKPGEIPTESGFVAEPQQDVPRSFMQRVLGYGEVPIALASGVVGGVVEPVARLAGEVFGPGKLGSAEATRSGEVAAQAATRGLYRPQSPEAQGVLQTVGKAIEPLMAFGPAGPIAALGAPSGTLKPAVRAVKDVAKAEADLAVAPIQNALQARKEATLQSNIAKSYKNAPIIDAAKAAQRQGLAVNPAVTNPTAANQLKGMVVGPEFDAAAAKHNAQQVTNVVRKDLGVSASETLTPAAIDRALDAASKPYEVIKKIPTLAVDDAALAQLQSLKKPPVIGGEAQAAASAALIDDATAKLAEGRSGAQVLDDIRSLRRNAQATYKAQQTLPDPLKLAQADTQMAIATALENLIDANAPSPQALTQFKAARQRMAQIFDHERAIDFANQTVNAQAYAKMLSERQGRMTGVGADIGQVAATFPSLMTTVEPTGRIAPKLARSGVSAAVGALTGGAVAGYPGAIAGASIGGGAQHLATRGTAKRMVSPEYQASRAIPQDFRPAPNMLRPAEITPLSVPNQLALYDWRNAVTPPSTGFTMPPQPHFGPEPTPYAQRSLTNEIPQQRARDLYESQKRADLATGFREAAERKPTSGEVILDFDPVTGRFREASQGLKGATPETVRNLGTDLASAADKVATQRMFDMTAAEKVAWERTKVDLAEVAPGLKKLTDAAIAEKMMDRQWVQSAIDKARQQAAAFEQIAARAKDAQAQRQALANRERMLDMLETLEEQFRAPRPVELGGQGPKTRAAQRNAMAPKSKNNLAP